MCIDRIASRVEQGGHDVPESQIRINYKNSFVGLSKCIPFVDKLFLFNNSNFLELVLVAVNQQAVFKHSAAPDWVDQYATPYLNMNQVNTIGDAKRALSLFLSNNRDR